MPNPAGPSARLAAFWRRMAARHRLHAGRRGALRGLLLALGPAAVLALFWPAAWPWAAGAVGGAGLLGWAAATVWGCWAPRAGWLAGAAGVPRGFADGMATWAEAERWQRSPLAPWFVAALADDLEQVDDAHLAAVGRRAAWSRRWQRRAVLLTLLALLLGGILAPPWAGLLGPQPPPPPEPPPPSPPELVVLPQGAGLLAAPTGGAQELSEPPLDVPSAPQFVVPAFVDEGPSRRAEAPVVELPSPAPQPAVQQGGREAAPAPVSTAERFGRAAENAQRARHVAPDERAMVRRYFERLREAGN